MSNWQHNNPSMRPPYGPRPFIPFGAPPRPLTYDPQWQHVQRFNNQSNIPQHFPSSANNPTFHSFVSDLSYNNCNVDSRRAQESQDGNNTPLENPCSTSRDNATQSWIEKWKSRTSKKLEHDSSLCKNSPLKLQDVSSNVKKWNSCIQAVKDMHQILKHSDDPDETKKLLIDIKDKQEEISSLQKEMSQKTYCETVRKLVSKRRRKRLQARKKRREKSANKKALVEEWSHKEESIDAWRGKILQQEREKRQVVLVKKEADSVLAEIRKKIQENDNMIKILDHLVLLRDARIKKGETHGYIATADSTQIFNSITDKLRDLLKGHNILYKQEKQTLNVMLEESSCSTRSRVKTSAQTSSLQSSCENSIYTSLFGAKSKSKHDLKSVKDLVKIRFDWDAYICESDDHPLAASIPSTWVEPPTDPDDNWKVYKIDH